MQHLDLQVVRRALEWSTAGQRIWLCTVLTTYGRIPAGQGRRGGLQPSEVIEVPTVGHMQTEAIA